ncbi:endonuclease/exonuclease/phosphatase family protein [Streptomyces bambusae]
MSENRMRRRLASTRSYLMLALWGLAAACVVTASGIGHAVPGNAEPLRFFSYNVCGNKCKGGDFDDVKRIDSIVDAAVSPSWKADLVFLQEVCAGQFDAVLRRLAPSGFSGRFSASVEDNRAVCRGLPYGSAVFARRADGATETLDLTIGGEKDPVVAPCIRSRMNGSSMWACSVHLYWGDRELGLQEAKLLAEKTRAWRESGAAVVLGGDFNQLPGSSTLALFDGSQAPDNEPPPYIEAGPPGQDPTFNNKKIDYVFLDSRHFRKATGGVEELDEAVSDHRMLWGQTSWAPRQARLT